MHHSPLTPKPTGTLALTFLPGALLSLRLHPSNVYLPFLGCLTRSEATHLLPTLTVTGSLIYLSELKQ